MAVAAVPDSLMTKHYVQRNFRKTKPQTRRPRGHRKPLPFETTSDGTKEKFAEVRHWRGEGTSGEVRGELKQLKPTAVNPRRRAPLLCSRSLRSRDRSKARPSHERREATAIELRSRSAPVTRSSRSPTTIIQSSKITSARRNVYEIQPHYKRLKHAIDDTSAY